jgi:hypothetical protein
MFADTLYDKSSWLSSETLVGLAGTVAVLYLLWQWALPKPIPGIPYNKTSAKGLFGDIPDMISHVSRTGDLWGWFAKQAVKIDSPIFQLWVRPFGRPWVVIYDFQESQDILLRRTKEFDRSAFFGDIFAGPAPHHHIAKRSLDPEFKYNRALLKDLMTPGFLHQVAAPQVYRTVEHLLELWDIKLELAQGHAFDAEHDVFHGALDAIYAATFGLADEDSSTSTQTRFLSAGQNIDVPKDINEPIAFPAAALPLGFESILVLTDSLEVSIKSPSPPIAYWFLSKLPYMRRAEKVKEKMIIGEVDKAIDRFETGGQPQRCAIDDILRREKMLAEKEERLPNYRSRSIYDEVSLVKTDCYHSLTCCSCLASSSLVMTLHPQRSVGD